MRVVVLSRQSGGGSAEKLTEAFNALGHECLLVNTVELVLQLHRGKLSFFHEGKALGRVDGVLARIGHGITSHGVAVLRHFELEGVPTFPSSAALLRSRQKLEALQHLAAAGVDVPKTAYVHQDKQLDTALAQLPDGPLIVKVLQGTGGKGVVLAESRRTAQAIASALISAGKPVLLQEFVAEASGRDVRAFVIGDEVVGAVERVAQGDEFRSNVHLGAKPAVIKPKKRVLKAALLAAQTLGLEIAGVDVLESRRGPLVIEVNSSPGLVDFQKIIKKNVADLVAQHVIREIRRVQRNKRRRETRLRQRKVT